MHMGDVRPSLILVVTEISHLATEHISQELNAFFGRTRPQNTHHFRARSVSPSGRHTVGARARDERRQ